MRDTFFPSMWSAIKRVMGWDMMPVAWNRLVLMPVSETDYQCHNRNYLKPILKNIYLLKIVTVVYTLNCNVPGFINTKTSNKHKLLSLCNLPLLFYQPPSFLEKNLLSPHSRNSPLPRIPYYSSITFTLSVGKIKFPLLPFGSSVFWVSHVRFSFKSL